MQFPRDNPKRLRAWWRPLLSTVLLISILLSISFISNARWPFREEQGGVPGSVLTKRGESESEGCRDVYYVEDRCAFVKVNCDDEQAGLIPYLTLYYCDFNYNRFSGFALLTIWLGLLFTTIGITASDFFSPNLQTIANVLSMPENLAGVTFLAIGNGSPDVFSTVMAMRSNSAAMAVGELIGAASFITAIVAGTVGCVTEFKVGRNSFFRDMCFFIVAVCFTMGFLIDGHLYPVECIFMIGYYIFYVAVVGGSHWVSRWRARRREPAASPEAAIMNSSSRQLGFEPYRDGPDEPTSQALATRSMPTIQVSTNETPRISLDGALDPDDGEDERRRHRAAEIANNMRVRRPTHLRRNTSTYIRPSLVGAFEFKSAIDHFRKEEALGGSGSSHGYGRRHSVQRPEAYTPYQDTPSGPYISVAESSPGRERALSQVADVGPSTHGLTVYAEDDEAERGAPSIRSFPLPPLAGEVRARTPSPAASLTVPGRASEPATRQGTGTSVAELRSHSGGSLRLQIPSRRSSASGRSETLSPFPGFTDSPLPMTPNEQGSPQFDLPASPSLPTHFPGLEEAAAAAAAAAEEETPRRWTWWPHSVLPSPEDLASTLFPTLQNWRDKGFVDMMLSAISVPSVFLLSITLPVVDPRGDDDGCSTAAEEEELRSLLSPQEAEWDRFRRRTRSGTMRSSTASLRFFEGAEETRPMGHGVQAIVPKRAPSSSSPARGPAPNGVEHGPDHCESWNRWQIMVQIALGPPFAVFIITWVLLEQPFPVVKWALIYTAIASAACLAFLLIATRFEKRPKYFSLLCFPGFLVSVAWIVAIAGEVVGVLKAVGVILGISEAILGLTIFAAGNSVGDWVADLTLARLGSPVMAFSGCIGGPMLNILLGIGIGGLWTMSSKANHKHKKHPDRPFKYQPYKIQISPTLLVSAVTLLVTLLAMLVFVSRNKWVYTRKLGVSTIILWCVSTVCNLLIEGTGVWSEMS